MSFQDDLDADLKDILGGEFNEEELVVITVGSIVFNDVKGIFDDAFFLEETEGIPIQSRNTQIGIFIKDIDSTLGHELSEEDQAEIAIGSRKFRIGWVERDGKGYARIELKKK